jgi:DNA-binding NarL/FixJ family response regulator
MSVSVLIADDHPIFRQGLRGLLEKEPDLEVVGEAGDGLTTVALAEKLQPDVVVMDLNMPQLNGIEATRRIVELGQNTRVLVLSMEADRRFIVDAFEAGAAGYVLKDVFFKELGTAIRTVCRGERYIEPKVQELIVKDYLQRIPEALPLTHTSLTPRERELLQAIADGKNTKELAAEFGISVKTVEVHRLNIMKKLAVNSLAELVKYAVREGLTSLR